ncbi:hypothetical protein ACM66B_000202 [Microbotryomycetes sp. NB124-2]
MFASVPATTTTLSRPEDFWLESDGRARQPEQQQKQQPTQAQASGGHRPSVEDDAAMLASYLQQQQQQHHLQTQQYLDATADSSLDNFDPGMFESFGGTDHQPSPFTTTTSTGYMPTATGAIQGALMSSTGSSHASSASSPDNDGLAHSRSATTSTAGLSPPFGVVDYSSSLSSALQQQQYNGADLQQLQLPSFAALHRQDLFGSAPQQQQQSQQASFVSPQQVSGHQQQQASTNGMVFLATPSNNAQGFSPLSHQGAFDSTPLSTSDSMYARSTAFYTQQQQDHHLARTFSQGAQHYGQQGLEYARPSPPSTISPRHIALSSSESPPELNNATATSSATKKRKSHGADASGRARKISQTHQQQQQLSPFQFASLAGRTHEEQRLADSASIGLIASAGMPTNGQMFAFAPEVSNQHMNEATAAVDKDIKKTAASEKRKKADADDGKQHNAVERRYRNNINNSLAALRDAIPALQHLKPLPSMPQSRRKASQFSIPSSATAATPKGLVDGVPAAKTLSKGSILSKAVEYITYLQGARSDREEDLELFKRVVLETVTGGEALVRMFEERKAQREVERVAEREEEERRREAEEADSDGSDEEDEDDEPKGKKEVKAAPKASRATTAASRSKAKQQASWNDVERNAAAQAGNHLQVKQGSSAHGSDISPDTLAQLRQHFASGNPLPPHLEQLVQQGLSRQPGSFPLSPASSSEDGVTVSPRYISSAYPQHAVFPQRTLLATFVGLSFASGVGYDLGTSSSSADDIVDDIGARAWSTRLVRRDATHPAGFFGPAILTGLACLGVVSVIFTLLLIVRPSLLTKRSVRARVPVETPQSRSVYRQRRRADALASLARLKENTSHSGHSTYASERLSALKARRELLKLVGAPTLALLPSLLKEGLALLLRNTTTIRVGSFSRWTESERTEAAVAWVRIAEIEATVGRDDVGYLARCYTFLRLFNLSHSKHWPETTPTTVLSAVNAVLAVHLLTLHQPLSALALWSKAARQAHKDKSALDVRPPAWADVAMSVDFATVRGLFVVDPVNAVVDPATLAHRPASPSDSVPLLRIAETQCAAALREAWSKIFVSAIETTCPPLDPTSPASSFSTLADSKFLKETVDNVLESTVAGSAVHCLALLTKSLCQVYFGQEDQGVGLAKVIELDRRDGGVAQRLSCVEPFVRLVLGQRGYVLREDVSPENGEQEGVAGDCTTSEDVTSIDLPMLVEADLIAQVTLGWLLVRHQVVRRSSARTSSSSPTVDSRADPTLHHETMALRRLLSHEVFRDAHLSKFCSASYSSSSWSTASSCGDLSPVSPSTTHHPSQAGKLDLESALETCLDSLTMIMRSAAGLKVDDDSGCEV